MTSSAASIQKEQKFGANNYEPLQAVISRGEGIYVWDVEGRRYVDMLSAYSALSFGHCHPELVRTLTQQARQLTLISRAFFNDKLAGWLEKICLLTGMDRALPMNTGAEAVETAIKAARRWAYTVKGVPDEKAEIIVCAGNFHGRTTTIVGMSSDRLYKDGFGPFAPGFKVIPYGDLEALQDAITPNTAAFLVEPIQGEAGIIVPPMGYLRTCLDICRRENVLFFADEIQTGLGRTGALLACDHEQVKPDGLMLGKALGGGLVPISAFLAREEVMKVFRPGSHGSTFGGNPLAVAVSCRALDLLEEEQLVTKAKALGELLLDELNTIKHPMIKTIRGKGLFVGVEIDLEYMSARELGQRLMNAGILTKDTHVTTLRFAPPLIITAAQLRESTAIIRTVFEQV